MAAFDMFSLYSHQMVAAILVHPSKEMVIPIAVEALL
jgi:hypothetical protein